MCLNCCGIKSRLNYPEFGNMIKKHDIICLVETKTDDIDKIDFPDYKFYMKNRKRVSNIDVRVVLWLDIRIHCQI